MGPGQLATVLLAAGVVMAQDAGGNLTTTPGPTFLEGETVVHTVTVGLVGHTFDPTSLQANPGDKVMFKFYPGNHSFIQSLYGWPCVTEEAVKGTQGVNSGQFPNVQPDQPVTWNLTINDTQPIWYYCGAPGSCINFGMLGAINPTNASEVEAQIDLAKQARYIIYPNDTLPAAAASSISALAANVLPQYWANNTSSGDSSTPGHHHGLSAGAIAGIAIGAFVGVAIIGILIFCLGRNKGQIKALKERVHRHETTNASATAAVASSKPPPPQEMTVDGVTYVPASTGTFNPHASYLPPYHPDGRLSPDPLRSKSPASTMMGSGPYSPPMSMHQFPAPAPYPTNSASYPNNNHPPGNYRESQELGAGYVPESRHELYAPPIVEREPGDVEGDPK